MQITGLQQQQSKIKSHVVIGSGLKVVFSRVCNKKMINFNVIVTEFVFTKVGVSSVDLVLTQLSADDS